MEILYPDGLPLPEEYHFRYDSTEEEARACLTYFLDNWSKRLGMPHPGMALFGDRDFHGGRQFRYALYDESTHIEQAIENFAFRQVQFCPSEEGKLWIVRIYDGLAAAEKLGDYPIIRARVAEELLRNGHYLTNVPHALTGEEPIAKVELVSRSGRTEQTLLPYYRFYVEITDAEGLSPDSVADLKLFGAYYVPAVEPAYLENMP